MSRRRRRQKRQEPREVSIESMSHEGRGITHVNGKAVFVFAALPGEKVLMQVDQSRRKFDEASTLEVLESAPRRIEPRCAAFQLCGGCSLQHLDNDDQVEFKQQSLLQMMAHAGITPDEIMPPLRGPAWGYRDKARLGVRYVPAKGRVLVGFRERKTSYIADMHRCEVLVPAVGDKLDAISQVIGELEARAQIPQIEVATDGNRLQLVSRHLAPLSDEDRGRLSEFARQHDFDLLLQPGGPQTVTPLYPESSELFLYPDRDRDLRIGFEALDFVQVNRDINRQMVAQAIEQLELNANHRVLDLFCGLGNFTLPLASRSASVTGVEVDAAMLERARVAARANGIDNTEYYSADLNTPDEDAEWMRQRYDRILLDPPRSGAQEIARGIGRFRASRIVYVSCQPSSLVRDAGMICEQGYRLRRLGVMDMFPQTAHIEAMAVFEARTRGST